MWALINTDDYKLIQSVFPQRGVFLAATLLHCVESSRGQRMCFANHYTQFREHSRSNRPAGTTDSGTVPSRLAGPAEDTASMAPDLSDTEDRRRSVATSSVRTTRAFNTKK